MPDVEEFTAKSYHKIPKEELQRMIRHTIFAVDENNARFTFAGVCFECQMAKDSPNEDVITAVATDGRRLAIQKEYAERIGNPKIESEIIYYSGLRLVEKILKDKTCSKDVKMAFDKNRVMFHCGDITMFSRLLEGRFPKWDNDKIIIGTVGFENDIEQKQVVTGIKDAIVNHIMGEEHDDNDDETIESEWNEGMYLGTDCHYDTDKADMEHADEDYNDSMPEPVDAIAADEETLSADTKYIPTMQSALREMIQHSAIPDVLDGSTLASVQREDGQAVSGAILQSHKRGKIVFMEWNSGFVYHIPAICCKKSNGQGFTILSITDSDLSSNKHLANMFTARSLF
ncbi:MAG: hypothetical protein FWG73_06540 [Planctomycetaceae bacterium]|nr:hypothetical protein [Planctomycetaceae bacterium]